MTTYRYDRNRKLGERDRPSLTARPAGMVEHLFAKARMQEVEHSGRKAEWLLSASVGGDLWSHPPLA